MVTDCGRLQGDGGFRRKHLEGEKKWFVGVVDKVGNVPARMCRMTISRRERRYGRAGVRHRSCGCERSSEGSGV